MVRQLVLPLNSWLALGPFNSNSNMFLVLTLYQTLHWALGSPVLLCLGLY